MKPGFLFSITLFVVSLGVPAPALARTWEVGAQRELKRPSEAAAVAQNGDTVLIDPGTYDDCALWRADRLTIEGKGDVTIQGPVCGDKALFVVAGSDILIRGINFARARAPDRNGAGIRAEGINLTVENSRFTDNEDGILAGDNPGSHIIVQGSDFRENGICAPLCAHGIYVNHIASLQVFRSSFFQQYQGHHIKSRALRTEIAGNTIRDGEAGTASYAVDIPDGGDLMLVDNVIEKGPRAGNTAAAVSIGEESARNATGTLTITGNQFANDGTALTAFVRNQTQTGAVLSDNVTRGPGVALVGPGTISP